MPSSSLHLPSTAGKRAIPSVPCLGGIQSIYISSPDKDLFFCSMFNRSFTSLGERTASSLRMRLSSARASLWLLFVLFFRFDNLHIYGRPVQQEHAQISQNYSGHLELLKPRTGAPNRTVFPCRTAQPGSLLFVHKHAGTCTDLRGLCGETCQTQKS